MSPAIRDTTTRVVRDILGALGTSSQDAVDKLDRDVEQLVGQYVARCAREHAQLELRQVNARLALFEIA